MSTSLQKQRRRLRTALAGVFVVALIATGCMPPLLDPPTSGRNFGSGPLDAVREASDRATTGPYANCDLNSTELAAMMIVPTYFEAGGTIPSPMTLSRWDNISVRANNANLFAFSDPNGPYVNAFFSPGIGLWQFDSAGGWDMTAADAIDATNAANQAASTIGYRWCNAPSDRRATPEARRMYAWGPWYGCTLTGTRCEERYREIVSGFSLNIGQDGTVSRTGGMQQRLCSIPGIGTNLTCFYVNPALAQGSTSWRGGTYSGPSSITPLPKPFYVVRANGNEYRFWITDDTGYDIGITASKPVRSNARTSLTWTRAANMCDLTTRRGMCGAVSPIGFLDNIRQTGLGRIQVSGWAFDYDGSGAPPIRVQVNSRTERITANVSRPDVQFFNPYIPTSMTGFSTELNVEGGPLQICVVAENVGGGSGDTTLGCRQLSLMTGNPVGMVDVVRAAQPGRVYVAGWAADPDSASAVGLDVSINGVVHNVTANGSRPDVGGVFPLFGNNRGFAVDLPVTGNSPVQVCVTARNIGPGGNAPMGCRSVNILTGSPIGFVDGAVRNGNQATFWGWTFDPDSESPVGVHVNVGSFFQPQRTVVSANASRPDVGWAYPQFGPNRGFNATVTLPATPTNVCIHFVNAAGTSGANRLVWCATL